MAECVCVEYMLPAATPPNTLSQLNQVRVSVSSGSHLRKPANATAPCTPSPGEHSTLPPPPSLGAQVY